MSNIVVSSVLCFFFLFPANVLAGQASLAWDPPDISTDVTGYMIHYGTASGVYSQAIDVGTATSYTVSNLIDGQTYFFAVTAYNAVGYESVYSNEVSIAIASSQYLLLISKPGAGQGAVSGSGISCGNTCLAAYNPGTVVSLSAIAAPGSTFDGWSGGGCSGTGLCTVTMNANITITANFKTAAAPTTVPTTTTSIRPTTTPTSVPTTIPTTTIQTTISTTSVPTTVPPTSVPTTVPTTTIQPTTSTTSVPPTIGAGGATLYFPHVDTNLPWQTEIAVINTSPTRSTAGTLKAFNDEGQLIETKALTLPARGRRQIVISSEFAHHSDIGYIILEADSAAVQGYMKFYQEAIYRTAIPAVNAVNTSDIYIPHIASEAQQWTGISLVNTTSTTKELTITFNTGQSVPLALKANEHKAFTIGSLLNQPLQPGIRSAVIANASGVIGLELFGTTGGSNHLDGVLLTDNTASAIYYPHVAGDGWWTGIVAYNPSESACTITVAPYSAQGDALSPATLSIGGKEKRIGSVADLGLPAQTAWFRIDSTCPLSGFALFGTVDGNQLATYAGGGGTGAKAGVFAKIEKKGWTGIAFVNTEASTASVTLTAYSDNGSVVATRILPVGGHAKVVNLVEAIFSQSIGNATYIAYSSDRNVVGFQINGAADETMMFDGGASVGMMLDGLPALAGTN